MSGSHALAVTALLLLLPAASRASLPSPKDIFNNFRIIVQRPDMTGVFSGDFNSGPGHVPNPIADLIQVFSGTFVPLQVFHVNHSTQTASQLCKSIKQANPDVSICEPDLHVKTDVGSATPNDPLFAQQWNMKAIKAPEAWAEGQTGDAKQQVRICMVDTGTDYNHPDMAPNLWINPIEKAGPGASAANGWKNGIDDDGNGIIDDIYGANFADGGKDGEVLDQNGHGTFVAGVVGAVGNNALGVTGINQVASIVTCRFMDATGNGWVSDAIRCFEYCMSKDSHVLSNSWGGVEYSQSLQTAVDHLSARGALMVASAGNDGVDTDSVPHYPSSLPDEIILCVGAATNENALWARSNYGNKTVQIAAPGVNVLSTGLGGLYITLTGTSMATPHVAGAAALLLAQFLQNGYDISTKAPQQGLAMQVKKILLSSSTPITGSTGVNLAAGLLNVQAALQMVPIKPGQASAFGAFGQGIQSTQTESGFAPSNPFGGLAAFLPPSLFGGAGAPTPPTTFFQPPNGFRDSKGRIDAPPPLSRPVPAPPISLRKTAPRQHHSPPPATRRR